MYWIEHVSHDEFLEHSAKGSTWKNHKYVKIEVINGKKRYIYPRSKDNKKISGSLKRPRVNRWQQRIEEELAPVRSGKEEAERTRSYYSNQAKKYDQAAETAKQVSSAYAKAYINEYGIPSYNASSGKASNKYSEEFRERTEAYNRDIENNKKQANAARTIAKTASDRYSEYEKKEEEINSKRLTNFKKRRK